MDTPNVAIWGRWSLGVALALLNCVLSSMGFTLQRLSHVEEMKKPEEQQRPPSARPAWIIGVSMYMMAALPDVFAYALAPQIVCSTVACARLVMVTLFAHIILDEKIHSQVPKSLKENQLRQSEHDTGNGGDAPLYLGYRCLPLLWSLAFREKSFEAGGDAEPKGAYISSLCWILAGSVDGHRA